MKGRGVFAFLGWKAFGFICGLIVVAAICVMVIGEPKTRTVGVTAATVTGTATDVVLFDMLPAFFTQLGNDAQTSTKGKAKV